MNKQLIRGMIVFILVLAAISFYHAGALRASRQRAAAIQSQLEFLSRELPPGLKRPEVEEYLRAHKFDFVQRCCVEADSVQDDWVKIGETEKPWYCSEHYVYAAFVFLPAGPYGFFKHDLDVLKSVKLQRELTGCL